MSFIKSNIIGIILILSFILTGCAERIVIQTQEVYIPVKCKQVIPERPSRKSNVSRNIIDILEYTEKLEKIVQECVIDETKENSSKI